MSDYLVVPYQQFEYVEKHALHNALAFYLALKFQGDKFRLNCPKYKEAYRLADLQDARTRKKHLQKLLELNWIGYNPVSGVYHVNGTLKIRQFLCLKNRTGLKIFKKDIQHIRVFTFGSILSYRLLLIDKAQKFKVSKEEKLALKEKRGVKKGFSFGETLIEFDKQSLEPKHVGMSVAKLGQVFNLSPSTCSELKQKARELGYIKIKKKILNLRRLEKPDYKIRNQIGFAYPEISHRLRFTKCYASGEILLGIQLYDEIFWNLEFKRLSSKEKIKKMGILDPKNSFSKNNDALYLQLLKKSKGKI